MSLTRLIVLATVLAWVVVALGAYVRLSDAGLGCPDWPGCYGHIGAPSGPEQQRAALAAFPDRPVEAPKAWKEMIHRYAAGTLGLLILAIFVAAWREKGRALRLSAALVALVTFQALLGRWTVTELLKPAIVSAHLLGGMATLALLAWLALTRGRAVADSGGALRVWAALALAAVAGQIALGGWTSAHYAALACGDGLTCRGAWIPPMDFAAGFFGSAATADALTAIHWSHRVGALAVCAILVPFVAGLFGKGERLIGGLIAALLALQLALGAANVALGLPLASAVPHNAVAALLLVALVAANWKLRSVSPSPASGGGVGERESGRLCE
ncbi:MAG: COX15/CtaA family protein [Sulfuricella sp.]|nr:COX15/CtaA family protein [Sulfuricella sp.]